MISRRHEFVLALKVGDIRYLVRVDRRWRRGGCFCVRLLLLFLELLQSSSKVFDDVVALFDLLSR